MDRHAMSESMAGALAAVQLDAMTFHSRLVRQGGAFFAPGQHQSLSRVCTTGFRQGVPPILDPTTASSCAHVRERSPAAVEKFIRKASKPAFEGTDSSRKQATPLLRTHRSHFGDRCEPIAMVTIHVFTAIDPPSSIFWMHVVSLSSPAEFGGLPEMAPATRGRSHWRRIRQSDHAPACAPR